MCSCCIVRFLIMVLAVAGSDTAGSICLKLFLLRHEISKEDLLVDAGDGERLIVRRALRQMRNPVLITATDHLGRNALIRAIENSCKDLSDQQLKDWYKSQQTQKTVKFISNRGDKYSDLKPSAQ
jgi:hypothetical protein